MNEQDATLSLQTGPGQRRRAAQPTARDEPQGHGTNGEAGGADGRRRLVDKVRRADRRDLIIGWLVILGVGLGVASVNALTTLADVRGVRTWEPWVWEFSSLTMVAVLVWIPWLATTVSSPIAAVSLPWPGRLRFAGVHAAALLTYTTLHVIGFVALRQVAYDAMQAGPYQFDALGAAPVRFLYELRKDALSYGSFVALFTGIAWARRMRTQPLKLVSFDIRDGSRTIRTSLSDILAVSSAGNYVQFWLSDGRRPLMRTTLTAIEADLADHGFIRTHRSWLINRDGVSGLRPTGSGDWTVELGKIDAPVSRRYPQALERLRA